MAKTTGSTADFSGSGATLIQPVEGSGIVLEADFLFSAEFVRLGDDLLLRGADGSEILLPGYFAADAPPPLETADGARLMPQTIEALAAPETVQGYAQVGGPLPFGQPIGEISLLNGTARVQRPDGTRADLHEGDPIFQGDVVSTGVGSDLGIVFIDETVFSLSANARMIINELIYNPGSTANSLGVSLIQGTFVFVTGQVAPNGGMQVETPVGTIGIRGTTVGVEIATFNGRTIIANLTNPDTGETGSFIFSNNVGDALFTLANHYLDIRSANADPGVPRVVSGQDITSAFGRALSTAIQLQRSLTRPDPEDQGPGEQEGSLEGDTLQALQEAGLTPEQIEALLSEPIETAAGPQGVQNGLDGTGPLGQGSSFGGGLQTEAESNSGNPTETPGGVGNPPSGTLPPVEGGVTPPPGGESNSNPQQTQTPPAQNAAPVVTVAAPSAMEDELLPITAANLHAADAETSDPAQLVYTVQSMSNGYVVKVVGGTPQVVLTFTQADVDAGLIHFQHDGSESTEAGFSVTAADPQGGVSPVTAVTIPVTPVNDAPVANDDAFAADADGIFTGDVLADNGYGADWDEENDALTISAVNGSAGAVGETISLDYGNGGLLTVNEDGSFSFDPDGDFDYLGEGESAEVSFTYTVSDGNGGTDTATVTIAVDGANDAPDAVNDQAFTNEDTPVTIDVLNGSGADSDPDGDDLTVTEVNGIAIETGQTITLPSGALLTLNADGTFSYDPNGQFEYLPPTEATEDDSFTYTVSDGNGGSSTATVTVTITGVNDAPDARDDAFAADADSVRTGSVFADNGSGADSDPEADPFDVTMVNGDAAAVGQQVALASGALLTLNADGTFSYDPNGTFDSLAGGDIAEETFSYTITDANGATDTATVTVAVDGVNDAPEATAGAGETVRGATATLTTALLTADDVDHPDPADIVFTVTTTLNGSVQIGAETVTSFTLAQLQAGLVTFAHDGSADQNASFTVVAEDPQGGTSASATVNFSVADAFVWTGDAGDDDWDNPANWQVTAVPTAGTQVEIPNGSATFSVGSLALASISLQNGTLAITGGALAVDALDGDLYSTLALSSGSLSVTTDSTFEGAFGWNGGTLAGNGPFHLTGNATFSDGPLTLDGNLSLESTATISADIVGSGSLSNAGTLTVSGVAGIATAFTNTSDGTLTIDGDLDLGGAVVQQGSIAFATSTNPASLTVSGGPLTNEGSITVGGAGPRTIDAEIVNQGTITFDAATTLSGSDANHVNASGGTLTVNADVTVSGAASFTNSGTMTVASGTTFLLESGDFENATGGVLNGGGTIVLDSGTFTNNGTINPGSSPGTLTIDGDFVQEDGGVLRIEVDDGQDGPIFDVLSVTGSATLNGGIVEFVFAQGDMSFDDGNHPIVFLDAAGGVTDDGSTSYRFVGFNEDALVSVENGELELNLEGGSYYYGGGPGIYYLGGSRADNEVGSDYGDDLYGGGGSDTLDGGSGSDDLFGGAGDDFLTGGTGSDELDGGEGSDRIEGGEGADWLEGGDGDDSLIGGDGDDDLDGGAGTDTLTGGEGADYFVLRAEDAADTLDLADLITDFELGVDRLDLAGELSVEDLEVVATEGGSAIVLHLESGDAYLAVLQNISSDVTIQELTGMI